MTKNYVILNKGKELNIKLYKKLRIIPIVLIIVSIIIGINLIKNNENSFIDSIEKNHAHFDITYNNYKDENVLELNSASFKELCTLPGVGSEIAERIVAYRIDAGGFTEEKELLLIKGISESLFENILPFVVVDNIK